MKSTVNFFQIALGELANLKGGKVWKFSQKGDLQILGGSVLKSDMEIFNIFTRDEFDPSKNVYNNVL